jgi:SAM-dependent methyltransferase
LSYNDPEKNDLYDKFLNFIRIDNPKILDVGTGLGYAAKYFINKKCNVSAIDNSPKRCEILKNIPNLDVVCIDMFDIDWKNKFNGIWASSVLLHSSYDDMYIVFYKLLNSLKEKGIFYCDFMYGDNERIKDDGRNFTDMNEDRLNDVLLKVPDLKIKDIFTSKDSRPDRNRKWLRCFLQKI